MTALLRTRTVSQFSCLGDKCEDTCCKGWSMQVDDATLARYRAEKPELLAAVEPDEGAASWIMRKDEQSGYCVKLEGGLCGIHKDYGEKFLGDACHFYPRVTRSLGDTTVMTATPSCPEIVRLMLAGEDMLALEPGDATRLPQTLKNYLPEDMSSDDALAAHRAFVNACADQSVTPERILLRAASASRSLELIAKKSWGQAAAFYIPNADARIPAAESNQADPFNLLHALSGLIVASRKKMPPRLLQTVGDMERALAVKLDWEQVLIHTDDTSVAAYARLKKNWEQVRAQYDEPLRRYLAMQFSLALFPFAGLGANLSERITIIGVRLATVRLALMCSCAIEEISPQSDTVVRVIQSLSRFMDHLGNPGFSLQIYAETGWTRESRLCGLLDD